MHALNRAERNYANNYDWADMQTNRFPHEHPPLLLPPPLLLLFLLSSLYSFFVDYHLCGLECVLRCVARWCGFRTWEP